MQHLCLKLEWDLPLDPRQQGATAQSAQAQAILGKRPSSSANLMNEPEKVVGPARVGDRYEPSIFLRKGAALTSVLHQPRVAVRRSGRWKVAEGI